MLAVAALSAGWSAVLYGIATALLVLAAVVPAARHKVEPSLLLPLGLAFFTFVFFWQALALS